MWAKDVRKITDDLMLEILTLKDRVRELETNRYRSVLKNELIKQCNAYRVVDNKDSYHEYGEMEANLLLINLANKLVRDSREKEKK